jgi:hypothetical protein
LFKSNFCIVWNEINKRLVENWDQDDLFFWHLSSQDFFSLKFNLATEIKQEQHIAPTP